MKKSLPEKLLIAFFFKVYILLTASQKLVNRIYRPFFTTKPTGEDTGLGLSLSYDIIKANGSEIKVRTKEGERSCFIILLISQVLHTTLTLYLLKINQLCTKNICEMQL